VQVHIGSSDLLDPLGLLRAPGIITCHTATVIDSVLAGLRWFLQPVLSIHSCLLGLPLPCLVLFLARLLIGFGSTAFVRLAFDLLALRVLHASRWQPASLEEVRDI
jgi:hypothetical protein